LNRRRYPIGIPGGLSRAAPGRSSAERSRGPRILHAQSAWTLGRRRSPSITMFAVLRACATPGDCNGSICFRDGDALVTSSVRNWRSKSSTGFECGACGSLFVRVRLRFPPSTAGISAAAAAASSRPVEVDRAGFYLREAPYDLCRNVRTPVRIADRGIHASLRQRPPDASSDANRNASATSI